MRPIVGSIVALVTPMLEDGSVDYAGLRKLIDWHIAEGTDCIGVVGTTGESPTVSVEEHCEIIRVAVEHAKGRVPIMAGVFAVITFAAIGLPGLNSFVGEFMTMLGAWERAPLLAVFAAIGLVLTPVYMLRLFQGVTQGEPVGPAPKSDIYAGQLGLLTPLVLLMFVIGLYPAVLTNLMISLGQAGLAR